MTPSQSVEKLDPGRVYTLTLKRREKSGHPVTHTGRFVKHTFTREHEDAILLGVVGEGRTIRIATSLITHIEEVAVAASEEIA